MASPAAPWTTPTFLPPRRCPSPTKSPLPLATTADSRKLSLSMRRRDLAVLLLLPSWSSSTRRRPTTITALCSSPEPNGEPKEEGGGEDEGTLLASEDVTYLWKLVTGSIGGAAAIKYGSVLYPDITRPNIVQALLMISLPVVIASLILIKESITEPGKDDLL